MADTDWSRLFEEIDAIESALPASAIILSESPLAEDTASMQINTTYNLCPNCGISGRISGAIIVCEQCGMEREWDSHDVDTYSITIDHNYNTSANTYMAFNVKGPKSFGHQRCRLKIDSDTSSYRNNNNRRAITNTICRYGGHQPPSSAVKQTIEMFDTIKQSGQVFRGQNKTGVIAACLYYSCIQHGWTQPPHEVAKIMNIDEKFIIHGDRILQDLHSAGIISIPVNHKPIHDYIDQFFAVLRLPQGYKPFVMDLIKRVERKRLCTQYINKMDVRCAAAITILCQRIPHSRGIHREQISQVCGGATVSAMIKYQQVVERKWPLFRKTFKKHRVPMPVEWSAGRH